MKLIGMRISAIVPPAHVGPALIGMGPDKQDLRIEEVYAEGLKIGPEKKKAPAAGKAGGRPQRKNAEGLTAKEVVLGYFRGTPYTWVKGADVARHMRDTGLGSYTNTFAVLVKLAAAGQLEQDGKTYRYAPTTEETPANG